MAQSSKKSSRKPHISSSSPRDYMTYSFDQGGQSNIVIRAVLTSEHFTYWSNRIIARLHQDFQLPGYRKGKVPMSMFRMYLNPTDVSSRMFPEYVEMVVRDFAANNPDYSLIGEVYDFVFPDMSQIDGKKDISLEWKVDYVPSVQESSQVWKGLPLMSIDDTVSDEKLVEAMQSVARQFAEYSPAQETANDTVIRCSVRFFGADGSELKTKFAYFGLDDHEKYPDFSAKLCGHSVGDRVECEYISDILPPSFCYQDGNVARLECTITDIQRMVVPVLTDEFVAQQFGNGDVQITSVAQLESRLRETLKENLLKEGLEKAIDAFIVSCMDYLHITIPKTYIDHDVVERKKQFAAQFGGQKRFDSYLASMQPQEKEQFEQSIRSASITGLQKYFIFCHVCKEFGIPHDLRKGDPDAGKKLYDALRARANQ
ncbi:MAG: hypothetical protein NZL83_00305 [Candidatus Absconditabacterales bacterium]|nr:hypothetical protein [Candidatus Absconditabacterales bacterium]